MKGCAERGAKRMRVHILLDGRDVAPGSAPKYIDILEKDLAAIRKMGADAVIASGGGRMAVTMDRYEVSTTARFIAIFPIYIIYNCSSFNSSLCAEHLSCNSLVLTL